MSDDTSDGTLPDVETWLRERSQRPAAALDLWRILLTAMNPRTGEIPLTRDELAAAVGIAPRTISEIMTELEGIKAISRHPHGRHVRYSIHPLRLGGTAAGTEADGAAPEDEPGGLDGEPLVDPGAQDAQVKNPGETGHLKDELANTRAARALPPFAAWAAEQIATLQTAWTAAEMDRKASLKKAEAAAARQRKIRGALILLAIGLGAGWWWTSTTMQAEVDAYRAEVQKAAESAGEQAQRIEELEANTASPNRPKPSAAELNLLREVDSYLAAGERAEYQREINRAWKSSDAFLGRLMDACWFGLSGAQRAKAPECTQVAQPAERGYWRRK